jgi:tetratricopeptide (TPR) repeat protein
LNVPIFQALLAEVRKHLPGEWGSFRGSLTVALLLLLLALDAVAAGTQVVTPDSLSYRLGELQSQLRRDPGDPRTHYGLAEAYQLRGNLVAARASAEEALRLGLTGDDSTRAALLLADIAFKQGRTNDARRRLVRLVSRGKASPDAMAILAQLRWDEHFRDDALVLGMAAAELDPADDRKSRWLAERWKDVGRPDLALHLWKGIVDRGEGTEEDLFQTGYLAQRLGNRSAAAGAYSGLLSRNPAHPEANYNLALIMLAAADTLEACRLLERAILSKPDLEQAYFDLAVVYIRRERIEDARRVLQQYRASAGADSLAAAEAQGILESLAGRKPKR